MNAVAVWSWSTSFDRARLQKHVARTVDRIQASNVRGQGRGRTVHRGAFLFFDHLLLQKRRRRLDRFFFFVVVVFQRFSKRCFT